MVAVNERSPFDFAQGRLSTRVGTTMGVGMARRREYILFAIDRPTGGTLPSMQCKRSRTTQI
jgi:hypothetical protein